jgi:hypothetical protein
VPSGVRARGAPSRNGESVAAAARAPGTSPADTIGLRWVGDRDLSKLARSRCQIAERAVGG